MAIDAEKIKEQAKSIIDSFASELEKIEVEEELVEREEDRRQEKEPSENDSEFRKIIFENAPNKKGDCIVAEKGKWTK
jgi:Asp-tRNA(Asn)/Glu-tRNA(Gln) amidotransferase C subunit